MTKKQGYSSVVCFVTISIIVIILLLNGMIIHAEGSTYWDAYGITDDNIYELESQYLVGNTYKICMTYDQYRNSSIYDSNVASRMPLLYSVSTIEGYLWNNQSTSSDYFIEPLLKSIPADIDPYEYPYFIISTGNTTSTDMNNFTVYFLSENSNFISMGSYAFVSSDSDESIKICKYNYSNGVYSDASGFNNPNEVNDISLGTLFYLYYTNMPILCSDTSFSNYYEGRDYYYEHPENFVDQNYLLYDSQGNPNYNNPNIGGGGSDAPPEGSENNLYLESASWKLMNKYPYGNGTTFTIGNVSFSGQCNDYMIQHPEEFQIVYTFEIDTQLYYRVTQDVSWGISKVFTASNGVNISNAIQANYSFQSSGFTQSLSDFMSGSYGKVFSLEEIYESSDCTSAFNGKLEDDFTAKDFNDLLGSTFGTAIIQNIGDSDAANVCQFKYYNVTCNAYIEAVNKVSPTSNLHPRSGLATSVFDLVSGRTVRDSDDITYNNNPYYDNTGDDSEIVPTSDIPSNNATGGSATSSSGGNNQVVTINGDDSAKYLPTLINKLVPDAQGDGGLSEDFQELSNSNGWIQYMSATFAFIPIEFWTTLNTYFIAFVGIIGVAFIIRIILDLL